MPLLGSSGLRLGTTQVVQVRLGAAQVWAAAKPLTATWNFTTDFVGAVAGPFTATSNRGAGAGTDDRNASDTQTYATTPVWKLYAAGATGSANNTTVAMSTTNNVYRDFRVASTDGRMWTPSTLKFNIARGGSGSTRTVFVRGSKDAYAGLLVPSTNVSAVRPTFQAMSFSLSSIGPIADFTVRIYGTAPFSAHALDLDDVVLEGTYV